MISQHITWHTGRLPPAVGVGVPDDPSLRPPPAPRRSAGAAGGGGRPQRGNPREGSPFDPLLRFVSIKEFRALRRAAMGSAPSPRPLFCKKAGQKTFKRQFSTSPSPSPLGRVIQSVREADTLAAEWHLPREWERRVGPETSRGRHHPKSVFLWGSTPFLWARPKKWGGIAAQPKVQQNKTASSSKTTAPQPTYLASGVVPIQLPAAWTGLRTPSMMSLSSASGSASYSRSSAGSAEGERPPR